MILKTGRALALGYFLAVFLLAGIGHTYFFNLPYVVALRGFSVVEYLAHALEPLNFARDFPGGSYSTTDNSILTQLYIPLKQLTGLSNIDLMTGGIWLEILSVIAGATVLWHSLAASVAGEPSREDRLKRLFVGGWLVTVLVSGNVIKPNLSNFGAPFFHGQFYGYADALAFVSLAAYLRGKWVFVTLALIAAFAVHPIKAMMPCVFIGAAVLANIRTDLTVRSVASGVCVALFAAYWAVFQLNMGGAAGVPNIPDDVFIAYSRIQQYHWYPAVTGLISFDQDTGLVPFFAVLTMALIAGLKSGLPHRAKSAFLSGFIVLAGLTAWGIYISIDLRSAFLIKLCLIRASDFMVQLSPFLICLAIYQTWRGKEWLWFSIFIGFVLAALFPRTQPSYFLAFAAAALFLVQSLSQRKARSDLALPVLAMGLFFLITQLVWWRFPGGSNPLFNSAWAVLVAAACYIGLKVPVAHRLLPLRSLVVALAFSLVFLSGAFAWLRHNSTLQGDMDFARSFYRAQEWAQQSTDKTALFMVDPCLNYGWRDFSERSSIGTPREWYMTGWGYVSDFRVFRRGQEIGQTLGMDLTGLLPQRDEEAKLQIGAMCTQARELFYAESRAPLRRMHETFGVDYFVMHKGQSDDLVQTHSIEPVYANDHVRIFSAKDYLK
ncbi:hypothetical protein LL06_23195 [Hoeflea sp. BAL378]|uniref:hypothetical protein n=1 Tax=Hoeflea sp. BAL378 TaxID=1547437 RepID=UPI000513A92F|nr:hypothetical protein [Hoeflea sp. BAL378]KGF67317.1 hypothetical protein LL06_23195 [Hoeflea sp. BAL378]